MNIIKKNVHVLLIEHPMLRDCTHALTLAYYSEIHNVSETTPFCDVIKKIKDGEIPSFATIERRSRQILQENEELRTPMWYKRQNMEIPVQEDLGYSFSNYRNFVNENNNIKPQ